MINHNGGVKTKQQIAEEFTDFAAVKSSDRLSQVLSSEPAEKVNTDIVHGRASFPMSIRVKETIRAG